MPDRLKPLWRDPLFSPGDRFPRQIALVHDEDGELIPLLKHTQPGATPGDTSGSGDGQGPNPPPEEVGNPDYQTS